MRIAVGVFFLVLVALVLPPLPDGAEVPRWAWATLVAAGLFFAIRPGPWFWYAMGYLTVMAVLNPVGYTASLYYMHFAVLAIVFWFFRERDYMTAITVGAAVGMALNSLAVLAQLGGWTYIPQLVPMSGLFYNRNMGAEAAAMILMLVVVMARTNWRFYFLVPGILPTLYWGSRAPIIALGVAGALALWRRSPLAGPFASMMVFLGATLFTVSIMHEGGLETLLVRTGTWLDMLPAMRPWGHGLGSFVDLFPLYERHSNMLTLRFENAHNDFLQVAFELGVVFAVALAALVIAQLWGAPRSPAWYGLVVFLVEGCFGFPLYQPATGCLAMACAGYLFRDRVCLYDMFTAWRSRVRPRDTHQRPETLPAGVAAFPAGAELSVRSRLFRDNRERPGIGALDRAGFGA